MNTAMNTAITALQNPSVVNANAANAANVTTPDPLRSESRVPNAPTKKRPIDMGPALTQELSIPKRIQF